MDQHCLKRFFSRRKRPYSNDKAPEKELSALIYHDVSLEKEELHLPAEHAPPRPATSFSKAAICRPSMSFDEEDLRSSGESLKSPKNSYDYPRKSFSGLSRVTTIAQSLGHSTAKRRKKSVLAHSKSTDEPGAGALGWESSSLGQGPENGHTRRPSMNGWLQRLKSRNSKLNGRFSVKNTELSPYESLPPNGQLPAPISSLGEITGSGHEQRRQRTNYSSGAAARAAAAAQNELLESMRKMRLYELKVTQDSESGIGIERGDSTTGLDIPVVRQDPVRILPPELMAHVLSYLDSASVLNAELVSHNWNTVASSHHIWKQVFRADFRDASNNTSHQESAKLGPIERIPCQDWKGKWRARKALHKRWLDGYAAAIYLEGHTDSVYCAQFDNDKILTGSRDRTVRIWDMHTYKCVRVLGVPSRTIHTLQPLPSDTSACGERPFAKVYPRRFSVERRDTLPFYHTGSILCLQYDDRIMITGSSDNTLIVWTVEPDFEYIPTRRLRNHTAGVLDVCFDEKQIVSCSKDSSVCLWDRESGDLLRRMSGHRGPVNAVQLRGELAVSASGDGVAKLWNLKSGLCIKEFPSKSRGMACVEFSLDSRTILAGGNDQVIYLFDTNTGELVRELKGHGDLVRSLHLDSSSGRVVSGSYDTSVKAFDLHTGETVVSFTKWTASWILSAKSDYRRIVATSQDSRAVIMDFGYLLPGIELLEG
ncbi:MAG: hypothetical protein Q9217_003831 [Psora testacea]